MMTVSEPELLADLLDPTQAPSTSREHALDFEMGFGSAYTPWLEFARRQVAATCAADGAIPPSFAAKVAALAEPQLRKRLSGVGGRALLATYNDGPTGHERFVSGLIVDRWRNMIDQFPVLGRLLALVTNQWIASTVELTTRLVRDTQVLSTAFGFEVEKLVELSSALGDPHNGGRCVIGVKDANGMRVAYKPRSLDVEVAFASVMEQLAQACAAQGDALQAPQPQSVNRHSYGWMEWVDAQSPCAPSDVGEFYRRVGALICAARVLSLSDLHLENLIAFGPFPVVIDLECLITPQFVTDPLDGDEGLRRFMRDSVMPSGLLPGSTPSFGTIAVDRAGLTGLPGAVTGSFGSGWVHLGTDNIAVEPRPMVVGDATNRPLPDRGKRPVPKIPTDAVIDGYLSAARALEARPLDDQLIEHTRPRVLFRSTQQYVKIIGSLVDPEALADVAEFDARTRGDEDWISAFDELGAVEVDSGQGAGPSWQAALVAAEACSMAQLDVPAFSFCPATGVVTLGDHQQAGIFRSSPLEDVRRRARVVGADADVQASLLAIALQGRGAGTGRQAEAALTPAKAASIDEVAVDRDNIVSVVEEMGETLVQRTLFIEGQPRWLTTASSAGGSMLVPALSGPGLYQGSAGTALVLAMLGKMLNRRDFGDLAVEAVRSCRSLLPDAGEVSTEDESSGDRLARWQLGTGWAGWLYAAALIGQVTDTPSLTTEVRKLCAELGSVRIGRFDNLDLIGGWSGVVLALDTVAALTGSQSIRAQVDELADGIAGEIERREQQREAAHYARLSMAHGVFGIARALRRASAPTSRAQQVADQLVAGQRARIGERDGLPSRVYHEDGGARADTSWCWGTAGYLISQCADHDAVAALHADDHNALHLAISNCGHGAGEIDRLCCGSAGRLIAAHVAAPHLDPAGPADRLANHLERDLIARWQTDSLVGDGAVDFIDASLYRGLAGVAYALAFSVDPTLPNVLAVSH